MNILFLLKPKINVAYISSNDSLRQALEKMERYHYVSIPILDPDGKHFGSVSEGDLLYYIKNQKSFDLKEAEKISIKEIERYREVKPITINNNVEDLIHLIEVQNYVPVIDDRDIFIGIITRRDVIKYIIDKVNYEKE